MIIKKELVIKNKGQKDVPFFDRLLKSRGLKKEELDQHIFYDPYLLNDMDKAVDRILKAIDKKEKIMIYGDYDGGATRF